jgi:hypothetical protein
MCVYICVCVCVCVCSIVALSHAFINILYTYVHNKKIVTMERFDGPGENYEDTIGVNRPCVSQLWILLGASFVSSVSRWSVEE